MAQTFFLSFEIEVHSPTPATHGKGSRNALHNRLAKIFDGISRPSKAVSSGHLLTILAVVFTISFSSCKKTETATPEIQDQYDLQNSSIAIASISGASDNVGVANAKWTGNAPSCRGGSNAYNGRYVVDCWDKYGQQSYPVNPYYWDINGKGFGNATGSISISGISCTVESWSDTRIRIRPYANFYFGGISGSLKVTKANSTISASYSVSIIPIIKSRGYGQCTYLVAFERMKAGLQIPTSAYSTNGIVNSSYQPKQYDVLFWDWNSDGSLDHTGIITSAVSPTGSGSSLTYTFIITEMNALCDEKVSTKSCTFRPSANTGIYSLASTTKQAKSFYR